MTSNDEATNWRHDGDLPFILDYVLECCRGWEPKARLLGNARAEDIIAAITALRAELAAVKGERGDVVECLRLTRGELEAIKNAPQHNEGMSLCGHNRYWTTHYGRCMACERDRAEIRTIAVEMERDEARGLLKEVRDRIECGMFRDRIDAALGREGEQ